MKTKSLLLGSAAALFAVTGARAADAVIIPEPEAVEYVRVCDAYGAGYFYIPGTETCLKISGYVRFEGRYDSINYDDNTRYDDASYADLYTKAYVSLTASSETEYGTLTSFIAFKGESGKSEVGDLWYDYDLDEYWDYTDSSSFGLDEAYLEIAGLRMGYFNHWLDSGIAGETDFQGYNAKFDSIRYMADFGGVSVGVSLDEPNGFLHYDDPNVTTIDGAVLGVSGYLGATVGMVDASVVGYYDFGAEEGGVRGIAKLALGPGSLEGLALWNSGASGYSPLGTFGMGHDGASYIDYGFGVAYAADINDKLTVTPGFMWASFKEDEVPGYSEDNTMWQAGVTVDYEIATNFTTKVSLQYFSFEDDETGGGNWDNDFNGWDFFWRFQRDF